MPVNFQTLSMMELRNAPGEALDRVAHKGKSFIVERNGYQLACLVPLSLFMPDIQPARLAKEFERLQKDEEQHAVSLTDDNELELQFRREGAARDITLTVLLPHGYPNASPKVYAAPVPDGAPHCWEDGSLCIFGATAVWNPGRHDVAYVLKHARKWVQGLEAWKANGAWPGGEVK